MIIALYIIAAVIMAVGSLYFAWRNRDFRKFLAGAFFVYSVRGTQNGAQKRKLRPLDFQRWRTPILAAWATASVRLTASSFSNNDAT